MALRRALTAEGELAAQEWQTVNEVLTFIKGKPPYDGPPKYALLMDQVYGPRVTLITLADELLWGSFQALAGELPSPGGGTSFSSLLGEAGEGAGWRFLGAPFDPQAFIFENLVYEQVSSPDDRRDLPSGLDVLAVLGSVSASQELEARGDFDYRNFVEQLSILKTAVASQSPVGMAE